MLSRLQTANEIEENGCVDDGRFKQLSLTTKGQATVARIHEYGAMRVIEALAHLDSAQQQIVAEGLTAYSWALECCRQQPVTSRPNDITIVTGYQPGMIGRIAQMHGEYYARHYDFGHFFEGKVASGLAEFSGRLNNQRNQIWLAVKNGVIVGSVAIDGEDLGNNEAHLRWFILGDGCRGNGVGRAC